MVWKIKQTQEEKSSKGRRKERKKGERQTHTFLKTLNYSNPKFFFLSTKEGERKKHEKLFKTRARERVFLSRGRKRKDTRVI